MLHETRGEPLSVEVRRAFPDALVVVAGELDVGNVGELYERFAELTREGIQRISLSLSELTFMDSTGLSLLIAVHKRTRASGGELVILSPAGAVRRLFAVAGLDSYFTIRPNSVLDPSAAGRGPDSISQREEVREAG